MEYKFGLFPLNDLRNRVAVADVNSMVGTQLFGQTERGKQRLIVVWIKRKASYASLKPRQPRGQPASLKASVPRYQHTTSSIDSREQLDTLCGLQPSNRATVFGMWRRPNVPSSLPLRPHRLEL